MKALVADTSVLIDLERGALLEASFLLPFQLVVPDLLYERELKEHGGDDLRRRGRSRSGTGTRAPCTCGGRRPLAAHDRKGLAHHLVRVLETGGETGTARFVRQLGGIAETARELAYRLYAVAEQGGLFGDGESGGAA